MNLQVCLLSLLWWLGHLAHCNSAVEVTKEWALCQVEVSQETALCDVPPFTPCQACLQQQTEEPSACGNHPEILMSTRRKLGGCAPHVPGDHMSRRASVLLTPHVVDGL